MNLTDTQRRLIERVVNVFETGTPAGKYDTLVIYADGPHDMRQITYGRSQTTEYGNLLELVEDYVAANGTFSAALAAYADRVGSVPLTDDKAFKDLLRKAGRTDAVMKTVQDRFFDKRYYQPAMTWADTSGFVLPLSALVIYDSFIHSGSIPWFLRARFPESPPANGGDERAWTQAYVDTRHDWLATHSREVLRKTVYRTACFQNEIARGNWGLDQLPISANGVDVTP
ncbi:MAG: chitosanase [bacterium]